MSYGLTPYDFVQQVYYVQEKVILDFHPDDDKYKEVLMEANLVLQELQNSEDWNWLREQIILGPMYSAHGEIPEFHLPDWVYKPSTRWHDCVRLYHAHDGQPIWDSHYLRIPYVSSGSIHKLSDGGVMDQFGHIQYEHRPMGAVVFGDTLTFDRRPNPYEASLIAVTDVQRRIEQFHICTPDCEKDDDGVCPKTKHRHLTSIPDPNYVIIRTAALHAQGSPPAQGRIADLTDQAQKLLSAMRQNDASTTDPDIIDWETPGWVGAI